LTKDATLLYCHETVPSREAFAIIAAPAQVDISTNLTVSIGVHDEARTLGASNATIYIQEFQLTEPLI
jgi:hypothetical protein